MENSHTMTGQDRVVLSNLLEKINAIHSLKEHDKFVFFLRKAMEEAKRRNAPHYYDRFHTMLVTSKLSKRAFESRMFGRDIRLLQVD